jgi:excisionase family DNA binding protein
MDLPLVLSVNDTATQLSVDPRTVWRMIKAGELKSITVGHRRMIPRDVLLDYLASRDDGGFSSTA